MGDTDLDWSLLLMILRTLRGWRQEDLAAASGVSQSTISKQEIGTVSPAGGSRERLEEALGVAGWTRDIQGFLGPLRARMLHPGDRRGVEETGEAVARLTEAALSLALADLRRGKEGESSGVWARLEWPVVLTVLRLLRGWFQEELSAASGVSTASISRQESGAQTPTRAVREKLEEALGVKGRTREIAIFLGQIRARMADPQAPVVSQGLSDAGAAAAEITKEALRVGLERMRRADEKG